MAFTDLHKMQLVTVLRARLTDYNSSNRGSAQWIFSDPPRDDLGKNSYPRISVASVALNSHVIDLARNHEFVVKLQMNLWMWADPKDPLILTIGSDTRSGLDVLDQIADDIRANLVTNQADFNDDTKRYHDMKFTAERDMPDEFDAKGQLVCHKIVEVEFTYVAA